MSDSLIDTAGGLLGLVIVAGVAEKMLDNDDTPKKKKKSILASKDKPIKW